MHNINPTILSTSYDNRISFTVGKNRRGLTKARALPRTQRPHYDFFPHNATLSLRRIYWNAFLRLWPYSPVVKHVVESDDKIERIPTSVRSRRVGTLSVNFLLFDSIEENRLYYCFAFECVCPLIRGAGLHKLGSLCWNYQRTLLYPRHTFTFCVSNDTLIRGTYVFSHMFFLNSKQTFINVYILFLFYFFSYN